MKHYSASRFETLIFWTVGGRATNSVTPFPYGAISIIYKNFGTTPIPTDIAVKDPMDTHVIGDTSLHRRGHRRVRSSLPILK
jgi:hypothetical protein